MMYITVSGSRNNDSINYNNRTTTTTTLVINNNNNNNDYLEPAMKMFDEFVSFCRLWTLPERLQQLYIFFEMW